jgi:hypothetical protein
MYHFILKIYIKLLWKYIFVDSGHVAYFTRFLIHGYNKKKLPLLYYLNAVGTYAINMQITDPSSRQRGATT